MRFEAVLGYKVASNWTIGCNYCYRIQYRINRLKKKTKQTNEIILFVLEKQASRQDWVCWTWNGRNTGTRIGIHCINHSLSVVFFFCLPWCCRNSFGGSTPPVSGRACCGPTWGGTLERSWIPAARRNLQTVPAPSSVSPDSIWPDRV